jgi:hypothetical protein
MRKETDQNSDTANRQPPGVKIELQTALAERRRFLEAHPHLQVYQDEIDSVLDKAGNHQGRLAVLGTLMQAKLLEIQGELCKLNQIVRTAVSIPGD